MKPFREQNYYEIFDLPASANAEQIRQAYELAKKTYGDHSLATYSLLNDRERKEMIERAHLAYEILSDEERRRRYDLDVMGLTFPAEPSKAAAKTVPDAAESGSPPTPAPAQRIRESPPPIPVENLTGIHLREIRERRGIPLQEIANRTRINITYFEFLEREQYRSLPPPVYLRSYIHQYARLLGLDPGPVADRVISLVEQARSSARK